MIDLLELIFQKSYEYIDEYKSEISQSLYAYFYERSLINFT